MVFQSEVTEQDEGLYTCCASFDHHMATVRIEVEVMSENKHLGVCLILSLHSKSRMTLVLERLGQHAEAKWAFVELWVYCTVCMCVRFAALVFMISISSASAIMLILIVALWVCW